MLLVGFTVWGIVCLRHSWKAMWTRLADWLVMSNSLPQREDEPLCGLHGWDASMWVQSCAHACAGTDGKQVFFLYVQDKTFKTFHLTFLSPLDVQAGKRSISEVRVTYTEPSRTSQFRSWERRERWAQNVDKGLHSETPQGHLSACTSHSFTYSPPCTTGAHRLAYATES